MRYDKSFQHLSQVRRLLRQIPSSSSTINSEQLSRRVRDLLFDAEQFMDAMVGYGTWYVRRKTPRAYQGAFLPPTFWQQLRRLEKAVNKPANARALGKAREIAEFTQHLTELIFQKSANDHS